MAHFTKFKAAAMGQMFAHINRDDKQTRKYGNKEIDPTRTPQNIAIVQGDLGTLQKRLGEVAHSARSDLVVCSGVVITLPEELKEASDKKKSDFFKECHNFLSEKFGAENCVYSVIHNDESTPHLHYGFVPVIEKEIKYRSKEKRGQTYTQKRVCADDVITRKMLNTFHDELQAHIAKKFPDIRIVSEEKEQRLKQNKSIQELKQEEIKLLNILAKKEKKNKKNIFGIVKNDEIVISAEQYEILQRKTEDLLDVKSGKMFEDYEKLKADNKELQNQIENQNNEIEKQVKEKTADLSERLKKSAWDCNYQKLMRNAAEKAIEKANQAIAEADERAQNAEKEREQKTKEAITDIQAKANQAIAEANERAQNAEKERAKAQAKVEELELQNGLFKRVLKNVWSLIKDHLHKDPQKATEIRKSLEKQLEIKQQSQGYSR